MTKTFERYIELLNEYSDELKTIKELSIEYPDYAPTQFSYDVINDTVWYRDNQIDVLEKESKDGILNLHDLSRMISNDLNDLIEMEIKDGGEDNE